MPLFTNLFLVSRDGLKQKVNKQYEKEKDYMATLQYVGIDTSFYANHTTAQYDPQNFDDNRLPDDRPADDCDEDHESIADLGDSMDVISNKPLLFFCNSETTGESYNREFVITLLKWQLL